MQKLLLTIAVIFSLNASASAATNFSLFFNDTRATEHTRKMANKLQFNEMTYILVKNLNEDKFKALDQAAVQFANNPVLKSARLTEIEAEFITQVNALLNPLQQASLQQYLQANELSNLAIKK